MSDLFKDHGILAMGVLSVSPRESLELLKEGALLIDLRNPDYSAYKAFDTEHVISLPLEEFDQKLKDLNPAVWYILADASGVRTRECARKMLDMGFTHVATLSGGFVEWERDGMPVRVDINERLTGACACQLKPRERKKEKK